MKSIVLKSGLFLLLAAMVAGEANAQRQGQENR